MKCPKLVINLFANNLSMMAIKECIDENKSPLDPMQVQWLQRMNKSIKAPCRRMKQAWLEHNATMDKVDADCLVELGNISNDMEAEVFKMLKTWYAVLQGQGTATNPQQSTRP